RVLDRQDAGIQMRQQTGLVEHEPGTASRILERGRAAERGELLARDPVAEFRLVAQGEERLAATGGGPGPRDREHLVLAHVRALAAPRRLRERAVAADVPAELGERDEGLRRAGDVVAVSELGPPASLVRQRPPG